MAKKTASRKPTARKTPARARNPEAPAPKRPRLPRLPADLKRAIAAAQDKKAVDLVVLDLRKTSAFTDFFVICTGTNSRQVQAIADGVQTELRKDGIRPALVEGYERAEWVLVDYFDFIFHIFSPATRQFYALERLWGDAERLELTA
jgi:ribosome-associated protein